jgi:hypothetical protein
VSCGSEYFRAMLEHAMVESGSRAFEMHEVQPRVLERVVEWLYSGELGEISDVAEGLALLQGSRFLGEAEFLGLQREAVLELVRSDGLAAWSERAV